MPSNSRKPLSSPSELLLVPLLSGSLFGFEFLLTRVLSYLVWYHYVFMIISSAVMGLGFGALWVQDRLRTGTNDSAPSLAGLLRMLAAAYLFVSVILYLNPLSSMPVLYVIIGGIPFVLGGAAMSLIFARRSLRAGLLYCLDLAGASAAAIGFYFILNRYGMVKSMIVLLAGIAAAHTLAVFTEDAGRAEHTGSISQVASAEGSAEPLRGSSLKKNAQSLASAAFTALVLAALAFSWSGVERQFGDPLGAGKLRAYGIQESGTTIEYTKWDSLSRTDVVNVGDKSKKGIFMDAASLSYMFRFNGDLDSVSELKNELAYLPFSLQKSPKTLLIGSGGGRDILMALLAGSKDITAVEINRNAVDSVRQFSDFSGDLYSRPEVRTYVGDGRGFIRETGETYDTVYLGLVMTQAAGAQGLGLSENYIFTKEAIGEYLERLNADGQVAFLAHNYNDMARIVTTSLTVLQETGLSYDEARDRIAVIAESSGTGHTVRSLHYPLIIVRREPFEDSEAKSLALAAELKGYRPIFVPGYANDEAFPLGAYSSVEEIISSSAYNIKPVTDDSPFFYNFDKGLPAPFYTVLGLTFMTLIGFFAPHYGGLTPRDKSAARYFFLIGLAYMAVEVVLIQRNTLVVGHPTLSFLLTVLLLLASGGIGSMASAKLSRGWRAKIVLSLLPVGILLLAVAYRTVLTHNLSSSPAVKFTTVALTAVPLGFAMGIPFPIGMERIRERGNSALAAYVWGLNGLASLLGSIFAMAVAMYWGFTYSLGIGAMAYYLAIRTNMWERAKSREE